MTMDVVVVGSYGMDQINKLNYIDAKFRPKTDVDLIIHLNDWEEYLVEYDGGFNDLQLLAELRSVLVRGDMVPELYGYDIVSYEWAENRFGHSCINAIAALGQYEDDPIHIEISIVSSSEYDSAGSDLFIYNDATRGEPVAKVIGSDIDFKFYVPSPLVQYATKLSHRYLRNSPHFMKTMWDIQFMRREWDIEARVGWDSQLDVWYEERMTRTYDYNLPNLNRTKEEFFSGDGITYYLDHDTIHEAVAIDTLPAYEKFRKPGAEVAVDMNEFFKLPEHVRMQAAIEESMVLCVERSLMPFFVVPNGRLNISPEMEFNLLRFAFEKVCTSITSGRFREWCWENYYSIETMMRIMIKHNDGPVARLREGLENNTIKRLEEFEYAS